ncbi:MAG: glycerol kinase [bacterium]|nr:glycerol kinase [bacterium]
MPELLLGLDVGSTSARAIVVDLSGRVLSRSVARLTSTHPAPGRVEQDPREVWKRVQGAIAQALSIAGHKASDLAGVGVAAQRSSVVIWDRATGEPVGPMILWSDLRGIERAAELQAAGHFTPAIAAVSKLEAALDAIEGGRSRAAAGELVWGTLDSFLVYRLTGGGLHVTDYSNAWSTCYLDLVTMRDWNAKLIEFQNLPIEIFPTLCETYGPLGQTSKAGLGAEIPIGAIIADQQSGMFAHHALEAGRWKATYGTSATLMVSTGSAPTLAPGLMPMLLAVHGDQSLFAVEGMVISAGALLDWLVGNLGLYSSVEELTRAAASVDSSGGVAIRPALQGLGAPHNDPNNRAAIVGLSSASTRAQIARAAFECLAFRMREITEGAASLEGIELPAALPVDGGLCVNDVFLQIQADILDRPVARHDELEATALGACVGAALGLGLAKSDELTALTRLGRHFEPTIDSSEAQARFESWREAVDTGAP